MLTNHSLEELRVLNEERKALLPANESPQPATEGKEPIGDIPMPDAVAEEIQDSANETLDSDEDAHQGRSLRRGLDRAAERKRKREAEQEKKEKAEAEAKIP